MKHRQHSLLLYVRFTKHASPYRHVARKSGDKNNDSLSHSFNLVEVLTSCLLFFSNKTQLFLYVMCSENKVFYFTLVVFVTWVLLLYSWRISFIACLFRKYFVALFERQWLFAFTWFVRSPDTGLTNITEDCSLAPSQKILALNIVGQLLRKVGVSCMSNVVFLFWPSGMWW